MMRPNLLASASRTALVAALAAAERLNNDGVCDTTATVQDCLDRAVTITATRSNPLRAPLVAA